MKSQLSYLLFCLAAACQPTPATDAPTPTPPTAADMAAPSDMTTPADMACALGSACVPQNACHVGIIDCASGVAVCQDTGLLKQGDLTCGPLAYWAFDGDGVDQAAGRDLTLKGAPGFATGLFGKALDLHHMSSQYATREKEGQPYNDEIFDLTTTDFTVQAWLYFYSVSGEQTFVEKFNGQGGPSWTFTKLTGNQLHAYFSGGAQWTSSALSLPLQVWHQALLRHRKGQGTDIFYNGQLIVQGGAGEPQPTAMPLLIGKRNSADGRDFSFDGRIDEVAIWTRALTDSEVLYLYNDGQGRKASEVN